MVASTSRIGVLSTFYPPFLGGAEIVAGRVTRMLAERGHTLEVHTLKHDPDLPDVEHADGVRITRHPFEFRKVLGFNDVHAPSLLAAVETWEVDVVHLHSVSFPTMLARAAQRLSRRGVPVGLISHGIFEAITGEHAGVKGIAYRILAKQTLRRLFHNVSMLGALSEFDVSLLRDEGVFDGRHRRLFNGVDLPDIGEAVAPASTGTLDVIHVASIKPNKGHLDVLAALAQTDAAVTYHIVGSGGDIWRAHEETVRRAIASLDLGGRIVEHGRVSDERRDELYHRADVVIVPSHQETFPLSVLEGMSYGKPVVATRVGGTSDMIDDGVNGLLIEPCRPGSIARALETLRSADLRVRLGRRARAEVSERFTWDSVVSRYEELTEDLRALAA